MQLESTDLADLRGGAVCLLRFVGGGKYLVLRLVLLQSSGCLKVLREIGLTTDEQVHLGRWPRLLGLEGGRMGGRERERGRGREKREGEA